MDFVARCSLSSVEGRVLNTVCFSGEREGEKERENENENVREMLKEERRRNAWWFIYDVTDFRLRGNK